MKIQYLLVLVIILLIIGGFYWYGYRPSEIRKECFKKSKEDFNNSIKSAVKEGRGVGGNMIKLKGIFYIDCLREHGLKE